MKLKTKIVITFIFIVMFFNTGCQHLIQLPTTEMNVVENTEIEKKEDGTLGDTFKVFTEMRSRFADPNQLNILVSSGPEALAAKEVSIEFEDKYNIKCNVVNGSWKEVKEIVKLNFNNISRENAVDVFIYPSFFIGEVNKYLRELNSDYIQKDNFDTSDYMIDIFDLVSKYGDSIVGIPIRTSIFAIMYRPDAFSNSGIKIGEKLSYEDYYKLMEELKNNKLYPNAVLFDTSELNVYWSNRYWSLGGQTTAENWEVTVNNELGIKSIEMLKSMLNYTANNIFDMSYDDVSSSFISGDSAMIEGYPDFLISKYDNIINSEKDLNISISPVPYGQEHNFTQIHSDLVGLLKDSKKSDKGWEWIKLFTDKEHSKMFLDKYGLLSPRISTFEDPELNSKYVFLDSIYELYKNSDIGITYKVSSSEDIWEIMLNNKLKDALKEDISSEEIIKEIENEWKNVLDVKNPVGLKYKISDHFIIK